MTAILIAILAVVLVPMLGGKLENLQSTGLRHEAGLLFLFALQSVARMVVNGDYVLGPWVVFAWSICGITILALLAASRLRPGVALMMLGVFANLLVVLANGAMPVIVGEATTASISGFYRPATAGDSLVMLADVLPVGTIGVASLGDLLLGVGLLVFVVAHSVRPTGTQRSDARHRVALWRAQH